MNDAQSRPFGRTILAGVILLFAAWVLFHFVIHFVIWLATVAVIILAIAAVIWALRVLL
jgi:hypothetical protein